jgi:hypothetical protein
MRRTAESRVVRGLRRPLGVACLTQRAPYDRMMTANTEAARVSLARLAEARFDIAIFGHGRAVRGHAVDRFKLATQ